MNPTAAVGVAVHPRRHIASGGDHVISGGASGESRGQRRTSTREKIARMVAEGATNYPSYLKLIYTGVWKTSRGLQGGPKNKPLSNFY